MDQMKTRNVFTALSMIGVVATAAVSVIAGMKIKDILDNASVGVEKHAVKRKVATELIVPAAVAGGTIFCMARSEKIATDAIVGLSATAGYLTRKAATYEDKLKEKLTPEEMDDIRKEVIAEELAVQKPKFSLGRFPAELSGHGDTLCYEGIFGRLWRSDIKYVDEAIRTYEIMLNGDEEHGMGCGNMNDFYDLNTILPTHMGDAYGYPANPDFRPNEIKFKTTLLHGFDYGDIHIDEDVYVIEPASREDYPVEYWDEV